MKYENKLSKLRHLALKVQGLDLQSVLLRAAAAEANLIAMDVYTAEEIFSELKPNIYAKTIEMSWEESYRIVSDAVLLQELKHELIEKPSEPFRWKELLEVLLDDSEGNERKLLEAVLTNQYNYTQTASATDTVNQSASFYKILVPIVRRIFTNFEAANIVGVQPLTGPVGLTYLLRYREEETEETEETDSEDTPPTTTEDLTGTTPGRKMMVDIISQAVESGSRKLQAGWTLEAMHDLNAMHGLDIEAEMVQALAQEIETEITLEILADLNGLAGEPRSEVDADILDSNAGNKVCIAINKACNEIARNTRRGAGNFIVVSPIMQSFLETAAKSVYSKTSEERSTNSSLQEVGILNGSVKVFTSFFGVEMDEILIGYKGGNGHTDTGYVYCPYVPVISSGIVINSVTFQPLITLMTRHGVSLNGQRTYDEDGNVTNPECLSVAEDYYERIKVNLIVDPTKDTTDEG